MSHNQTGEPPPDFSEREALEKERHELLERIDNWLDTPMLVLAFVWLGLLIGELIWGESRAFEVIGVVIWAIFIIDFILEFVLAPQKAAYIKKNWLTVLSLLVPALRIFRIFRAVRLLRLGRVGRGLRLFRVVSSLNRGMRALAANLQRRGFGYVISLSLIVLFAGAAGMYAFENEVPGGLDSYSEALWWTAMVMTTMGSQYWPQTLEGRMLCFLLALYAFAVFGYVTATLATYFVGRDAESSEAELAGAEEVRALRKELQSLRLELRGISQQQSEK